MLCSSVVVVCLLRFCMIRCIFPGGLDHRSFVGQNHFMCGIKNIGAHHTQCDQKCSKPDFITDVWGL